MSHTPNRLHAWRHHVSHSWFKRLPQGLFKNLVLLFIALGLVGSVGVLALIAYVSHDLPDPNTLSDRTVIQSTKIYDRTGEHLLYEIHGDENRTLVQLAQSFCNKEKTEINPEGIPLFAVQATIAAEDRTFCEHHGFSVKGILRAVWQNLHGNRYGGSTLTQQLVKQAILSSEKKISRKIKELILSIEIERRYSKDEILQIYFNEIPYGSTNYGIQAASQHYLKKDVKNLTLAEAATLAALPQRPTTFLNNPDLLLARRNWILDSMAELGFITSDETTQAKLEKITLETQVTNISAPHFVFYVKQLLEDTYGQREVEEQGLKVITSLDFEKQIIAETEVRKGVEAKGESYQFNNASLVAIDPKTSQILAMVGSKDFFDDSIDGQVNVALRPRQPGSSFKPIVYTAAFMKGYTPNTVLWDVKTDFPTPTGIYSPNNYNLKENGPLTTRKALQGSLNIPAVKILYLVGLDQTLRFAEELGYTTLGDRSRFGLAVVLGGAEVKLLEHVNAYATFANEGIVRAPIAILKVEDAKGNVLEEWKPEEGKRVMKENNARMISNVLSDTEARSYIFGAASQLRLSDRPVAVKTGTTNNFHDAWTVGYTPSLVAGVWVGNNNNTAMSRGADGSVVAAPIWNAFMSQALASQPPESFTAPEIPVTGKDILDGRLHQETVTIDRASQKLATEYTPASYREEKTFAEYHSILHYIQKDNPLGPPPNNPADDPYYESWEKGIQDWMRREEERTGVKIQQGTAPTEFDDVHIPAHFPSVSIESPGQDVSFESRNISIQVNASAPRGIQRVEFYIDGYYLGQDANAPYTFETTIPSSVGRGYHTIKAVAYDDVDNMGSSSVGIRLRSEGGSRKFLITDPNNGQTIERVQSQFTVVISMDKPADYESVSVYVEQPGKNNRTLIEHISHPESPFLTVSWILPSNGDWVLSAQAEGKNGRTETPGIIVHITSPSSQIASKTENTNTETIPASVPVISELNPFTTQ